MNALNEHLSVSQLRNHLISGRLEGWLGVMVNLLKQLAALLPLLLQALLFATSVLVFCHL